MKALIIGGSNGIGLAITKKLIAKGYFVDILDKQSPESNILEKKSYEYHYYNLLDFDEEFIRKFTIDKEINLLMITAGIGRVANFEYFHTAEIKQILTINTVVTIQILRIFYERIIGKEDFYCGVMGSISGWVVSPLAAVYSSSKAAICNFIESVNIELEIKGINNRILNISPSYFNGSCFYGGKNKLELLNDLADEIIMHLFKSDTLFIPNYEEKLKSVIEYYRSDPHKYGIASYKYKEESGRVDNSKRVIIGYLSGTFDLFHIGHLNLLRQAKMKCDYLIVGVHNSGSWKGKETFIPFEERKVIVASCKFVDKVVDSCHEDSDAWYLWHYDKLFVGSDYKGTERFMHYEKFFKDKGVEIIYFPYTKGTSSTKIREAVNQHIK